MTLAVVIVTFLAVGSAALVWLRVDSRRHRPLDTHRAEQWFVSHAPRRLRSVLRSVDRRVAGGSALIVVFGVVGTAASVVGWVFDTIDRDRGFARWDQSAAEWGSRHATPLAVDVLEAITQLGASGVLLVLMTVIGLVSGCRHRKWTTLTYLLTIGFGVMALNNLLKLIVGRERPSVLRLTDPSGSSFPSGHSAASAAAWAAIMFVLLRHQSRSRRTVGAIAALAVTVAVAASRVLLGVHWVTDVVAGVVTGWAWFTLVTVVFGGRLLVFGLPAEQAAREVSADNPAPEGAECGRSPSAFRTASLQKCQRLEQAGVPGHD